MAKIYLDKNVYDAAVERIEYIFNEFENIYFSFSGGKDSGVMVQLANDIAKRMGRKFDVLYIDLEGNYKSTRRFVNKISKLSQIDNFYWVCLPIKLRNAVSQYQTHWVAWDDIYRKNGGKWIRPRPANSINSSNYLDYGWDWFEGKMQFEDFIIGFAKWYADLKGGKVACGVGIRSNESLNRFRTIVSDKKTTYQDKNWTTLVKDTDREVYNFFPLYDWETRDIWIATFKDNMIYNEFYEIMYKAGLTIHQARLCQPYGDDQKASLDQFKFYEPETWGKVLMRVNGANFGNIYANSIATGTNTLYKPDHLTWEQYSIFLLETIGSENYDLMIHYAEKIQKFIAWWKKEELIDTIPDEADSRLESQKKAPSWRRICKMIMRNDYYGKTLSFSQTKADDIKLNQLLDKWSEIL